MNATDTLLVLITMMIKLHVLPSGLGMCSLAMPQVVHCALDNHAVIHVLCMHVVCQSTPFVCICVFPVPSTRIR